MKKVLFPVIAASALFAVAGTSFAGGAGCDSKKGHSKELSAESLKQHQGDHSWLFSEGDHHHGDMKIKAQPESDNEQPRQTPSSDVVEI